VAFAGDPDGLVAGAGAEPALAVFLQGASKETGAACGVRRKRTEK